ncbi:hypothetical protein ACFVVC_03720 [Pseudarthrobacter sp. NPDC058196]|uniref:hypothetical protein n=1 Tax=Pseudarthrobacter sp. NPDC058196 TaxID=3346376 RepID=UPI0036DE750C
MKITPFHFAYISITVALVASTVVCAIGWSLQLAPLKTEWGDVATWVGAGGTILGFTIAIATLWHNEKAGRDDEEAERLAQARRVGITSHMVLERDPLFWEAHQDAWKGWREHTGLPSVEERIHLDSYEGPWDGKVTFTVQNGSPYPLSNPVVRVRDVSTLSSTTPAPPLKTIAMPVILAGGTAEGKATVNLPAHSGESMIPDLVELEFSDVWEGRWLSSSSGCRKVEPADGLPPQA